MITTTERIGLYRDCGETHSGVLFDLVNPRPEDVKIDDIAHGLSNVCRFSGQCRKFYSVAEHSYHCYWMAVNEHGHGDIAFATLLHDAAEAYIGDMTRPIKIRNPDYREMDERLSTAVRDALGVKWDDQIAAEVRRYDNIAVRSEANRMMKTKGAQWEWGEIPLVFIEFGFWSPETAKAIFMWAFNEEMKVRQ